MAEQPHPHAPNPAPTPQQLAAQRRELTPDATTAFLAFSGKVFAPGALDAKAVRITVRNPRPAEPPRRARGNRSAVENIRQRLFYHYGAAGRLELDEGAGYYAATLTIPTA